MCSSGQHVTEGGKDSSTIRQFSSHDLSSTRRDRWTAPTSRRSSGIALTTYSLGLPRRTPRRISLQTRSGAHRNTSLCRAQKNRQREKSRLRSGKAGQSTCTASRLGLPFWIGRVQSQFDDDTPSLSAHVLSCPKHRPPPQAHRTLTATSAVLDHPTPPGVVAVVD
nr:hypothetical protein CFP56_52482 [Quercus suber]